MNIILLASLHCHKRKVPFAARFLWILPSQPETGLLLLLLLYPAFLSHTLHNVLMWENRYQVMVAFGGLSLLFTFLTLCNVVFSQVITRSQPLFSSVPTQTEISLSSTKTLSPTATGDPCLAISDAISNVDEEADAIAVDAEIVLECLQSVPFHTDVGLNTTENLAKLLQFQSTISFLKDPPEGYPNPPVDLLSGLNDIKTNITNGVYKNQYDFEGDIARLMDKSFEGHLAFDGRVYTDVFKWARDKSITLISSSTDGGIPKVYCNGDFNVGGSFQPSPVSQINGQDAISFLQVEADTQGYQDPDARWNSLFMLQAADSSGKFRFPRHYPGKETTLTFENGTTRSWKNVAVVVYPSDWSSISNGRSIYNLYVDPSGDGGNGFSQKRELERPTRGLHTPFQVKQVQDRQGIVPETYPDPFIEHPGEDVRLAGYFLDNTVAGTVGVLVIQTFDTGDEYTTGRRFQSVIQNFIAEAKNRGVKKMVIDLRDNGGGYILLGYEVFRQFFPSTTPYGGSRWRIQDASSILGEQISAVNSSYSSSELETSPFHYRAFLNQDDADFAGWDDMKGPINTHNPDDSFTKTLRWNLSDPSMTSDPENGVGITITGYNNRSNFTEAPFDKDDIIILSDGVCSSTCSLFVEMMNRDAGVRTLTIGGRHQNGPTQAMGGTRGAEVISHRYLSYLSRYLQIVATTITEADEWAQKLPQSFPMQYLQASVNFQDQVRKGENDPEGDGDGVPLQFKNDTSNCRLWYTPSMYRNVTEVWDTVIGASWGNNGKMDQGKCVQGSFREAANDVGGNNNNNNNGGNNGGNGGNNGGNGNNTENGKGAGGKNAAVSIAPAMGAIIFGVMVFLMSEMIL
jgi:hypothetical protein